MQHPNLIDGAGTGNYGQHWKSGSCQQYGLCDLKGKMDFVRRCHDNDNTTLEVQYCEGTGVYYDECDLKSCLSKYEEII